MLVDRLARKLHQKANRGQLRGAAEGVLLVATRHLFGVSSDDLDTQLDSRGRSRILHAALFGREGDLIVETPQFEGETRVSSRQGQPGVLTVPGDARAILWLFHDGEARLAERSDAPLSPANRQLLVDAFGAVVLRSPSTISSNAE